MTQDEVDEDDGEGFIEIRPGIAIANRPEEERIEKFTLTPRSDEADGPK